MILLDTSFIASYYNDRDENHTRANQIMKEIAGGKYGIVYLTDYIFDESLTVTLVRTKNLQKSIDLGQTLLHSTEILKIDEILFKSSWDIFRNQKSTKFSFTDCTILATVAKTGMENIATFDEEFKSIKTLNIIS